MPKKSEIEQLAAMVDTEINTDSKELAKRLKGEMVQPGEQLSNDQFIAYVASKWSDPAYRQMLHTAVGDENLINIAKQVMPLLPPEPTALPPVDGLPHIPKVDPSLVVPPPPGGNLAPNDLTASPEPAGGAPVPSTP